MRLQSKLQYKYYEPGEFISIAERTVEETIELIKLYPWDEQRHLTSVELTCPSITIRNISGDYLKLGPGYYQKFNLYLYSCKGRLLKQVVENVDAAISIVRDFYAVKELNGFFRERFIFNARKHFETYPFEYKVTYKRILWFSSFKIIFFSAMTLFPFFFLGPIDKNTLSALIWMFPFWFMVAGMNMLFLINYWNHDRNSVLIVSRGIDNFRYGRTANEVKEYNKKDILAIREYESTGSKNPWAGNIIIEIEFDNGEIIKCSNLLISSWTLFYKTPDIARRDIAKVFPFIK